MDDNNDNNRRAKNQEHLLISKLSREDIEDKYLKIYDENFLLKKHARKQEDRIKKMATKLIRLMNDKKKSLNQNNNNNSFYVNSSSKRPMRDIEAEEFVVEMEAKLQEYELQNKRMKENLQISRTQLANLQAQKNQVSNIYSNVTARIDTGLPATTRRDLATTSNTSIIKNIRTLSSTNRSNIKQQQQQRNNDDQNEM
jgi:protein fantom